MLPSAWPCTPDSQGIGGRSVVRKGDYVTVYAFQYNAVSYKALAPVVTTLKPEEPVPITLLAAVLQATGFTAKMMISESDFPGLAAKSACVAPIQKPDGCLAEIGDAVSDVNARIQDWERNLRRDAETIAAARPNIPSDLRNARPPYDSSFRIDKLDEIACKFSVVDRRNPAGGSCDSEKLPGWVQQVSAALGTATALVRAFDSGYRPGVFTAEHIGHRDRYKRALDGWIDYLVANQTGVRSQLAAGVAQLTEDLALIKGYRAAIDPAKAASYAVELPRQGPVGSLNKLLFALPLRFVGDPDSAPAQVSRTLTIEVAADRPPVLASAGLMWLPRGSFGFKRLAIEQVPGATPTTLSKALRMTDVDTFRDVTPLLATHFRLSTNPDVPYAVLGTTGDKNIFRTVLLGGSLFAPRWRSLITVGALGAKGSTEDDLQPLIDEYSHDGIVADSLNLGQIFADEKWYWTLAFAWTLTPF